MRIPVLYLWEQKYLFLHKLWKLIIYGLSSFSFSFCCCCCSFFFFFFFFVFDFEKILFSFTLFVRCFQRLLNDLWSVQYMVHVELDFLSIFNCNRKLCLLAFMNENTLIPRFASPHSVSASKLRLFKISVFRSWIFRSCIVSASICFVKTNIFV